MVPHLLFSLAIQTILTNFKHLLRNVVPRPPSSYNSKVHFDLACIHCIQRINRCIRFLNIQHIELERHNEREIEEIKAKLVLLKHFVTSNQEFYNQNVCENDGDFFLLFGEIISSKIDKL